MNFFAKAFDIFELCRLSNQRLDKLLREHGSKIAKEQQDMAKLRNILQTIQHIGSKTPTEQPLKVDKAGSSNVESQIFAKALPEKQKEPVPKDLGKLSKLSDNKHANRDAEANVKTDSEHDNNHSEVEDNNSEFEGGEELEIQIVEDVESQGKNQLYVKSKSTYL